MKIKVKTLLDVLFFLYICSLFDNIKISLPFLGLCLLVLFPNLVATKGKKIGLVGIWYAAFFLFFSVGILWAQNNQMYSEYIVFDAIRIVECLCVILWISFFSKSMNDIHKFVKIYVLVMVYLVAKLMVSTPSNMWGTERLGETINLQPTMLGLALGFGTVSAFYLWSLNKEKKYICFMCIFALVSMLTGSRNGVIILLLGVSAFYVFNSKGTRFIRNLIIVLIAFFLVYSIIMNVDALYNTIGYRFENFLSTNNTEQSVRERTILKASALELFLQNPIYGAGTEGFRAYASVIGLHRATYSHCNYTEMLANYGIIGFVIYYFFQASLLKKLGNKFKISKDLCFSLVVCIMILVSDYGYVSYYGIIQQFFLAIAYIVHKTSRSVT